MCSKVKAIKSSYLIYGAGMGILLVILQVLHYKSLIRDIKLEVFGAIIALIFLGLGLLLSRSLRKPSLYFSQNSTKGLSELSERELDVLHLLAEGLSNQEIADRLFVSLNTTKTHLSNIYSKLNVKSRTQAIRRAKELAILTPTERMKSANHPKV